MNKKERAPRASGLARGAQESICAGSKYPAFVRDDKSKPDFDARAWPATIRTRKRIHPGSWSYFVNINNGVIFVGFWGHATAANCLYAQLESELRGVLAALKWLGHLRADVPAEIRFSTTGFALLMGEAPCPGTLRQLLDRVWRTYLASADAIRIDRERHALVFRVERIAA